MCRVSYASQFSEHLLTGDTLPEHSLFDVTIQNIIMMLDQYLEIFGMNE